jgi:hypothetical protein
MSIRNHLLVIEEYEGLFPEGEEVSFYRELIEFYDQRYHRSIWFDGDQFKKDPEVLIAEIKDSYGEGLKPADYHLDFIENSVKDPELFTADSLGKKALLEILLTNAYLSLASDYLNLNSASKKLK